MFHQIVAARQTRRPWKAAFLSLSVVVHVVGVAVLLVAAMWQIDKLSPPKTQVTVVMAPRIPGPPPPAPRPINNQVVAKRRIPKVLTQPAAKREHEEAIVPDGPVSGPDQGDPDGIPGGDGDCFTCVSGSTQDIPELARIEPPKPPARREPATVLQKLLEGQRIAGNEQIHPPETVRHQMMRDGRDRLHGIIKMCLDETGQVSSLNVIRSTGYSEYDSELTTQMRLWRYEPYRAGGKPVPVCTSVDFIYIMR